MLSPVEFTINYCPQIFIAVNYINVLTIQTNRAVLGVCFLFYSKINNDLLSLVRVEIKKNAGATEK